MTLRGSCLHSRVRPRLENGLLLRRLEVATHRAIQPWSAPRFVRDQSVCDCRAGPADGHAEANTHPPRTGQVITPIAMNPQQPPTLMGGAGAAVDAQAQPCLFSSATLDAVLRSGPTAATGAPSAQQSSFENFWSLLQQRDASLEDLVHGPRAGGMSSQAMQLDGDYGFQYAPPPRADRAAQAIDALTHSGFACGAETRQGGELYGFEEMRRERSREAITNSHTQR